MIYGCILLAVIVLLFVLLCLPQRLTVEPILRKIQDINDRKGSTS